MTNGYSRCDWTSYHREESHTVDDDNANMSPVVRQKFWKRKRGQLTVASTESNQDMAHDRLSDVVGGSSEDGTNEDENVSCKNEPSTAEQVTVGAAYHKGDSKGSDVD